jgi:PKD repeat protein
MPLDVQFRFTGANAVRWLWTFGDGATSTEQHPAHVYSNPDTYSVKCEAWNADGVHAEITAPAYIVVASDAAPPSVVHMVTAAGVGRLLTYIARMWSWIQVLDSSGDAVGTRIYDTEMWSQDDLGQVWVDSTIPGTPLFPFLPLTVGGIEIWDAETGGNRITRIMFADTPGTIELPEIREVKDSITMHIGVGLTGSDTVPHIVDALIAGSTVVGDMAAITFRLYGGEGGYRIDSPTMTRDVPDGGTAQIRFIMNRVE